MQEYAKETQIGYQYNKLAYHFDKLKKLGETTDIILEKMLMSQAIPDSIPTDDIPKDEIIELTGYIKYPKIWNNELQAMFVKEGEDNSSIQLIFDTTGEDINTHLLRLENVAIQKTKKYIKGTSLGETKTGKPKIGVVMITDKYIPLTKKND